MRLSDEDLDGLYEADLADFVFERGALVKRLRSAGRREDAAIASKLAKPNRSAWAANQLVRRYPRQAKRLWAAVDALKEAHLTTPEKLAECRAEEREARIALAEALDVASAAGTIAVSPAIRDRALASLRAAAGHPEARPLAEKGMLFEDVADPGLDGLQAALRQGLAPHRGRPEARRPEPEARAAETTPRSPAESTPKSKAAESTPKSKAPESTPKSKAAESTPKSKAPESTPKSEAEESTPKSEAAESAPKFEAAESAPKSETPSPESPGAERARRRARRGEQERFKRALGLAQRELARSAQRLETARLRADEAARHLANLESQHAQVVHRLQALLAEQEAIQQRDMITPDPPSES